MPPPLDEPRVSPDVSFANTTRKRAEIRNTEGIRKVREKRRIESTINKDTLNYNNAS